MTFDSFSRAVRPAGGSGPGTAGSARCSRGEWMAQIILGIGASLTTLTTTQSPKVDQLPRALAFRIAMEAARHPLATAKEDVATKPLVHTSRCFCTALHPAFLIEG